MERKEKGGKMGTEKEKEEEVEKLSWMAAEMGRAGGRARAKALSEERRREIAGMGAAAREAKKAEGGRDGKKED